MPSHSVRVRRNYPEGVPQFGTRTVQGDWGDDPWGWEKNYLKPAREAIRTNEIGLSIGLMRDWDGPDPEPHFTALDLLAVPLPPTECDLLGHVYGHEGKCLFCQQLNPSRR